MRIFGIGTDIVKIERIAQLWQQHGTSFLARILTEYEANAFAGLKHNHEAFLAKRFAAKEAIAKALGTGFRDDVLLTQVGIETDEYGKPHVMFYGKTLEYVAKLGKLEIQISIADETDYVVAFVIITGS